MGSPPDLSIIIVNYNGRALLEKCVLSIGSHLRGKIAFDIHAVDNGSTDGSVEALRNLEKAFPELVVHLMGRNLGFARANNAGLENAKGRLVLLFNSDAYFLDASILQAITYLDSHPELFGLACMLLTEDRKPGVSYGRFPSLGTLALEIATFRFNGLRAIVPPPGDGVRDIDFPCGAFFLIRSDALSEVGLLDGEFFMYFEEADLAKRAKDLGYGIRYFGAAQAVHIGGGSSGGPRNPFLIEAFYRSWGRYMMKHHGPFRKRMLFALLASHHAVAASLRSMLGKKASAAHFRLLGECLVKARAMPSDTTGL